MYLRLTKSIASKSAERGLGSHVGEDSAMGRNPEKVKHFCCREWFQISAHLWTQNFLFWLNRSLLMLLDFQNRHRTFALSFLLYLSIWWHRLLLGRTCLGVFPTQIEVHSCVWELPVIHTYNRSAQKTREFCWRFARLLSHCFSLGIVRAQS